MKLILRRIYVPILLIAITLFVLFYPMEKIYIKESEPTQFLPGTEPQGLLKATNNYIIFSYGNLLNQNQKEYSAQILEFDSKNSAYYTFSKAIEYLRDMGIEETEFPSLKLEKGSVYADKNGKRIILIKENRIYSISGDPENMEKVVLWLINQRI